MTRICEHEFVLGKPECIICGIPQTRAAERSCYWRDRNDGLGIAKDQPRRVAAADDAGVISRRIAELRAERQEAMNKAELKGGG